MELTQVCSNIGRSALSLGLLLSLGCTPVEVSVPEPISADDVVAVNSDFVCIDNMPRIGRYSVRNINGLQTEAEAVAATRNLGDPMPDGVDFPIGTIIQVIPKEAMVKRAAGYDPANNDWEYFKLKLTSSGTTVTARGTDGIRNIAGECLDCHGLAKEYESICTDNPLDLCPLDFTIEQIDNARSNDPRC